ncbi:MAG: hypothetical protein ACI8PG_003501, partial [Planctomycetota bacterium]
RYRSPWTILEVELNYLSVSVIRAKGILNNYITFI